jgi:hypothetical protein
MCSDTQKTKTKEFYAKNNINSKMILDDSLSTLESWNDGKLHDFEDDALAGDDHQQEPNVPTQVTTVPPPPPFNSRLSSEASMDLEMIWAKEDVTDHTSQETDAYNSSLNEMEKLEQSLDQDMVGILNNQASATELRIYAIQNFLKLQDSSKSPKGKCCLRAESSEGLSASMGDFRPKKSVRFQVADRFQAAAPSDRPIPERFRLPSSAFSI